MSFTYNGKQTRMASFPLGGIGVGTVGLVSNGMLRGWEIFHRPSFGSINRYTGFVVKAEADGKVLDARSCNGDFEGNFIGGGMGIDREISVGWKHFEDADFVGKYPIAELTLKDRNFPGTLKLEAFNPFIPSNSDDSSIPCAIFKWTVENTSDREIEYTVGFNCGNIFGDQTLDEYKTDGKISSIYFTSEKYNEHQARYGNMAISTDCDDISYQEYWFRGKWFDEPTVFWNNFFKPGKIENRHYDTPKNGADVGILCGSVKLKPGEKRDVKFVLSWYIPNVHRYWNGYLTDEQKKNIEEKHWDEPMWKACYTGRFGSSLDVARYVFDNLDRLYSETRLFRDTLFSSSLPECVIDAIAGNIALLKSSTCMRLENGEFYGFEGTWNESGSCEGTCTHVWNYAYALPFLFPNLERTIRELDYTYNTTPTGEMRFRMMVPVGTYQSSFRSCADGQFGGVMKFYREWKISGDDEWLKKYWPEVKKSIEYAWNPENHDRWDPEKKGVLTGRQHHTLDMELFGANPWLTGFYLGALKAGAEIAEHLGEKETAAEYREIFEKGSKWADENLFNGKYYIQKVDINDKSIPASFGAEDFYWNDESGEIIYQICDGCEIDQILAQWHANLIGLGDIFPKDHCRTAMENLYRINFTKMRDAFNFCRVYAVDDEKGLIICRWDDETKKPAIPIPYSDEVMTGFEYAAGDTMLMYGLEDKALNVVSSIRKRYTGEKRNPWSEIECGHSYSRAMASYSFLLTYSGFEFDMRVGMLGFDPIHLCEGYSTFWAMDGAWGTFAMKNGKLEFTVLYGKITLNSFKVPSGINIKSVECGKGIPFTADGRTLAFDAPVTVSRGEKIVFA